VKSAKRDREMRRDSRRVDEIGKSCPAKPISCAGIIQGLRYVHRPSVEGKTSVNSHSVISCGKTETGVFNF